MSLAGWVREWVGMAPWGGQALAVSPGDGNDDDDAVAAPLTPYWGPLARAPSRFGRRRPFLSCVGRLDKETSGLLMLTDDGQLLHRIQSPRKGERPGQWRGARAAALTPNLCRAAPLPCLLGAS